MVNQQLDYEDEQWLRLDEAGLIVERVGVVRDMDGRDLQLTTFHEGILRNLTFNTADAYDPWPPTWTQPGFVWPPEVELLLVERVDALPPEAQAQLEAEVVNLACDSLREADEAGGDARQQFDSLYSGWLEALAAQSQEPSPRWLHVVTSHTQNEAAFPYDPETYPYPMQYTVDQWFWLNEQGLAEERVWVMRDLSGEMVVGVVEKDGRSYDLTTNETGTALPQRPSLDLAFGGNAGPFVWLQRETVDGREQLIFTTCQSYHGGAPMMGDLPVAIVGDQKWLWLDAETGEVIRTEWRYVDAHGQSHQDWQEEITLLEFVEELPPDVQALLERETEE
jgi:hypothetical protein